MKFYIIKNYLKFQEDDDDDPVEEAGPSQLNNANDHQNIAINEDLFVEDGLEDLDIDDSDSDDWFYFLGSFPFSKYILYYVGG